MRISVGVVTCGGGAGIGYLIGKRQSSVGYVPKGKAGVFILDPHAKKVLLVRQVYWPEDNMDPAWGIPKGGIDPIDFRGKLEGLRGQIEKKNHINNKKSSFESCEMRCALRELNEETNVAFEKDHLIPLVILTKDVVPSLPFNLTVFVFALDDKRGSDLAAQVPTLEESPPPQWPPVVGSNKEKLWRDHKLEVDCARWISIDQVFPKMSTVTEQKANPKEGHKADRGIRVNWTIDPIVGQLGSISFHLWAIFLNDQKAIPHG